MLFCFVSNNLVLLYKVYFLFKIYFEIHLNKSSTCSENDNKKLYLDVFTKVKSVSSRARYNLDLVKIT